MSYFRRIHTTQERKRWISDEELSKEYPELKLRYARSFSNLPNSWDDIHRSHERRSWKIYRENQYKIKSDKEKKESISVRYIYDTPLVYLGGRWWRYKNKFPYRVRQKYIKNHTG